jgi:surface antigen
LGAQAASLQDEINKLQKRIDTLRAQIRSNQDKYNHLQTQIAAAQKELDAEKQVLGENIKAMYLEGQISTLEMLASSKDLSDFVDKQQYRNAVADKIKTTVQKITELKQQLASQKTEVEKLLADQKSMNSELSAQQDQQNSILSLNESQQASLNHQIQHNDAKISELRRQQAIENARFNIGNMRGDPNNGGYPSVWANAPQDSMTDSWGMYNRECVSFTAWKVWNSGRHMPYWGGEGNANQWDDNARAQGIPVDSHPKVGDVAISNAGTWGHAMYVEAVGDGSIYISQYNASYDGQYSEGWRYTTNLVFIHYP